MIRRIIEIDKEKCNGCGACAKACHESAIGMVNGKATLLRDDYCDGLGDCLPECPTNAISFVEREALAYDEKAVLENQNKHIAEENLPCGCKGSQSRVLNHISHAEEQHVNVTSCLSQWPVQIKLAPTKAPYFENANLLIAADCTAYAFADFHHKFIKNRVTLIGCPKLDMIDYSEKLTQIILNNNIRSVTIVRMEVPCCGGIEHAVVTALKNSGKIIPWQINVVSVNGELID